MSALWIALGVPALLFFGIRLGWSFGYKDAHEDGKRERRGG